jgi:hypothetical protein
MIRALEVLVVIHVQKKAKVDREDGQIQQKQNVVYITVIKILDR